MDAVVESRRVEAGGRRQIVDRGALQAEIDAALGETGDPQAARGEVLALLKAALKSGRREVRQRFETGATGPEAASQLCFLVDQILRAIYDHVTRDYYPLANPSEGERLALIAVGGYGRGELAPMSDVDLLFLQTYKRTPRSEQVVECVLYFLWDLGLKVGQATRSVDDCVRLARADQTIRTNLLEARFLWGDQPLFLEFKERYRKEVQQGTAAEFIEAKLAERAERHKRQGNSRYALEPNIKDGKGGLRDLQTLFWIARYIYGTADLGKLQERGLFTRAETNRFEKAHTFLWTLRFHLHYLTGRAEERLTFDMQKDIAPLMGYTAHAGTRAVERFMKHYFLVAKDVGDLTRILCAVLEAKHNRRSRFRLPKLRRRRSVGGFRLEGDRLTVAGPEVFSEKPIELLRVFHVAQENDLDIHPEALRAITRNLKLIGPKMRADPEANRLFLEILTSRKDPETTLRRLNEAGVFGRFVPDFGRVVSQMQFNMYHHYTVDEHTIFAIGILHAIEAGRLKEEAPIASEVVHKLQSRRALFVAVLLHDIAKGRAGDHSIEGEKVALKLCPRLGFTPEETETAAWLVRHHLAMSDTAFKRDIDDPKTLRDFADLVQSMERLRLLLVLTVADIRAVGPGTWNAWKAALLRELYWRTEDLLSGHHMARGRDLRVKAAQEALKPLLADWPAKEIAAHMKRGYPAYWLSFDLETQERHARLVRAAEVRGDPLTIDTRIDRYREVTEITIYTADHPGLFSRIAGAMAVAGASVDAAKICTLANGMALDVFYVRDALGGPFDRSDKLARLSSAVEQTLGGRIKPQVELEGRKSRLPSRLEVFQVAPRVLIDNTASQRHTVIEVNARDRPGLLFAITLAITKLQLMIHSAKISTFGERAVDVFYVQDALGDKIEQAAKIRRIRQKLLEAVADGKDKEKPARSKRSLRPAAKKAASRRRSSRKAVAKAKAAEKGKSREVQ